ncbi:catechol 2,3-dioxygenase-like lactoylglutathione lyase family enzyme [Thermocatellispora tengchongensis]|uniref:Catechol 2,3-dioxygenase-like lactoylglutathione lyase family enzyme n=1 Tax=Thermocatellispora tengchongensis TaxID=1073253 RepID=A0A840PE06_9ACTN|nr:VOC family protein [Thermocatellispora tengchongensis]MBB5137848.1 catechol 2,3-dioxygenase-like lactoylglutathione lyase family enzyme [Thermocatellispora tengchongensis]
MGLHRLVGVTMGVPNVDATREYYRDFGLQPSADGYLHTVDGGPQLRVVHAERRRLLALAVGVDDADDLDRIARDLAGLGVEAARSGDRLVATDPGTAISVTVRIAERIPDPAPAPPQPRPGNRRSPAVERTGPVRPRKLGHVVVGSVDQEASQRFFMRGIGFKLSDSIGGEASFLRCSTDHHNLLVARAPVPYLHHTAWEVADVDEIGRGATAMLEGHPERHAWGLGRHHIGSNMFWYLRDPAGNFSEYYSDLDCIIDDSEWTPEVFEGSQGLYNWGPRPPRDWMLPEDIAAGMMGLHSAR